MEITNKLKTEIADLNESKKSPKKLGILKELQGLIKGAESYGVNSPDATSYINKAKTITTQLINEHDDPEWFYQLCVLTKDDSGIETITKKGRRISSLLFNII